MANKTPYVYLFAIAFVGLISFLFHALGLFKALAFPAAYSDIVAFYSPNTSFSSLLNQPFEYPILTQVFIFLNNFFAQSHLSYYLLSSLLLVSFSLLTTLLLYKQQKPQYRSRLWDFWVLAPSMLFFMLYNWDFLALFSVLAAFWFFKKGNLIFTSFFLALGFCAKIYPILYLIPLLKETKSWSERFQILGLFGLTSILLNAFFVFNNFSAWYSFFHFNSTRLPNPDSIWSLIQTFLPLSVLTINLVSLLLFALGTAFLLFKYPTLSFLKLSFLLTLLFLLTNKIFSPQYLLWLLPFFVLLPNSLGNKKIYYSLEAANLIVLFAIIPWTLGLKLQFYLFLSLVFVFLRHGILIYIFWKNLSLKNEKTIL